MKITEEAKRGPPREVRIAAIAQHTARLVGATVHIKTWHEHSKDTFEEEEGAIDSKGLTAVDVSERKVRESDAQSRRRLLGGCCEGSAKILQRGGEPQVAIVNAQDNLSLSQRAACDPKRENVQ